MKTNLISIKDTKETYNVISQLQLTQIYYESEFGKVNTVNREDISDIYLKEVSKIVNEIVDNMEKGMDYTASFQKAIFDETRYEILDDYALGFLNQQQLSDYLRDSYKDEDVTKGVQINDVYIR